jgi:glycosyltransferase involved in cell wall biosynthesis
MELRLPIIVVDDGSEQKSRAHVSELVSGLADVQLVCLADNKGKGFAVLAGARHAAAQGFTHILQIDADGQHSIESVAAMLVAARQHPLGLISGLPEFSADIPASRLHGRKITLFWARLETLSFEIQDAMCGFRVYPLSSLLDIYEKCHVGNGMDFDAEIMVRFSWAGFRLHYVPVVVNYPKNGVSHFNLVRDNIRISLSHTKLMIGMIFRSPYLIMRNISKALSDS